ncbi:hypothetical protein ACH5RR_016478 [Cinchona calisaya]|uniref:Uncharacterized protein n=1 Tax=Cinchona calisaya TaxID=153742 RepID=A0ABD2ZW45_9GENT
MFNIKVLSITSWMMGLLFLTLLFKCNATEDITLVISNEINLSEIVNFTCTTYVGGGPGNEFNIQGPKIVYFGDILTTKTKSTSRCEFEFSGIEVILETPFEFIPDPDVLLNTDMFLKFNVSGCFRRNAKTERWVLLNVLSPGGNPGDVPPVTDINGSRSVGTLYRPIN